MDSFPVNHLKDDFLWDGLEDDFQEELSRVCQDYVDFARQYRARTGGQQVSPAVVQATNDEIAQELTEEEMLERLTIAETGTVPDEVDPAVRDAKAEMLRAQKIEPRIVEVGGWTFRIYHPEGMAAAEPYFFRQSAAAGEIDIFLNDNHPYVEEVTDESDYLMYARMCVIDGIVEHFLLHHPGEVTALVPGATQGQPAERISVLASGEGASRGTSIREHLAAVVGPGKSRRVTVVTPVGGPLARRLG